VALGGEGPGRFAYAALLGLGALDAAGYGVIGPVVPTIAEATSTGTAVIGALVATFGVGMIVSFHPAAVATQRLGSTRVLAGSLALMIVGAAGFVAAQSLPVYFAARLLMGLGSGGLWTAIALGVIERWPGSEYRRLSGVMAVYSIGGIAGPALASIGGVRGPFLAYLGIALLGLAALPLLGGSHRDAAGFGSDRAVLRSPAFAVSAAAMVLVAITIGTLDGVLPLHFASRLDQAGIAALFVGTSLVVALFAVLAARLPLRPALAASAVAIVAGLAVAGAGDDLPIWIVGLAVAAVGFGLGETASLGFLLEATGPERMILAMVVWNQVFSIGYLVGPAVGGAVAQELGFGAIGLLPLVVAVGVVAAMLRLLRGEPRPEAAAGRLRPPG
jgi:MFS family permease